MAVVVAIVAVATVAVAVASVTVVGREGLVRSRGLVAWVGGWVADCLAG